MCQCPYFSQKAASLREWRSVCVHFSTANTQKLYVYIAKIACFHVTQMPFLRDSPSKAKLENLVAEVGAARLGNLASGVEGNLIVV